MFSITTTNSAVVALKQPQARCQTSEHSHVLLFSHPVLYRRECTNKALFTWTLHFRYAHIYMKLVFPISFICHEIVFSFFKFNNNIQINIKTILSSQVVWKEAVDYIGLWATVCDSEPSFGGKDPESGGVGALGHQSFGSFKHDRTACETVTGRVWKALGWACWDLAELTCTQPHGLQLPLQIAGERRLTSCPVLFQGLPAQRTNLEKKAGSRKMMWEILRINFA